MAQRRKRKVPKWVHLKTKQSFGLAGLWDVWRKPDGKKGGASQSSQPSLTI
jgi:putative SOS response-associated peptidase YedK